MGRFWAFLFLLVPILGVGLFLVAADENSRPLLNHWFPVDISEYGYVIDDLFMAILWMTGIVFVATEICLVWFMMRYDRSRNSQPVKFTHGSHTLEVVWTILPAATLLFIAIYQMNAWANTKIRRPDEPGLTVEVVARQFEWRLRYPGKDGEFDTPDDIYHVNDLHVPVDEDILVRLKSQDVLHSFFLPNLRVKQDAVPGMDIPVWFKAKKNGAYDLVCAELCGWGHYKMRGRLTVQSRADFDQWLDELDREGQRRESEALASSELE
ncbi:MAG: cytochrome c oxidase subunit II [Planctomycetota bacterium]|nr:MAG: cytochrome c oxidase subunit II [Planctomycetota bacterium]